MRSNCLIWALRKFFSNGGYVAFRWSDYGPFFHFLWTPRLPSEAESFVPLYPKRRWLPPLIFKGRVKRGDH